MEEIFIGAEAVTSGQVSAYVRRTGCIRVYPGVYRLRGTELTAVARARAAWLWSRRRGVIAGQSAAALHGANWVDPSRPAEIRYDNRYPPPGIRTWGGQLADDEIEVVGGIAVTSPARTALDLACRYRGDAAVAAIDALVRATHLKLADVELLAQRYQGRRGIRHARTVLDLVDAGAESPRETWLRLLLIRAGFPRPQTQIPVYDGYGQLIAVLDMGWEDIRVGVDYEGEHHRTSRRSFNRGIRRHDEVTELGWIDVRVTVEDTEGGIIGRVEAARARRR